MAGILKAAAAAFLLAGGAAHAADWRAMPWPDASLGLVDADSIRRTASGRISFTAHGFNTDPETIRENGFDRYSVHLDARCRDTDAARGKVTYYLDGRKVKPRRGASGYRPRHRGSLIAANLCDGDIGMRSFASPEAAVAEFAQHNDPERLSGYVSPEVELTGRVVQGFEMNGIALCGSEGPCVDEAPWEFCWLEGDVSVPVPADAVPGTIRRDTMDVALKGRIVRSRSGRGFGHLEGFGCQVKQTGPAREIAITQRPRAVPRRGEAGRTSAALAAHAALDAAFASIGAVTAAQDEHSWRIDALKARPKDWEAACGSDLQFEGKSLEPYPTAIMWADVAAFGLREREIEIRTGRYAADAEFRTGTPSVAAELATSLRRAPGAKLAGVEQRQRELVLHLAGGGEQVETFGDSASAVQAAGIFERLRGRRIMSVVQRDNVVTALPLRTVRLTFEDEGKARQIAGLLEDLRRICRAEPAAAE